MASKNKNKQYYSYILIYKAKRAFLYLLIFILTLFFTSILFHDNVSNLHWGHAALPIIIIGTIFAMFPPTEEWVYTPWQSKPQSYEHHSLD